MSSQRISQLIEIMAALRNPDKGCPWDLEQTYRSIVPYTLEEAHEVAETIEHGDMAGLKSELGDLLFQVVFYARLAEEDGLFSFEDVVETINEKMVRRHPHVFGDGPARTSDEIAGQWERLKDLEKTTVGDNAATTVKESVLDGVPLTLPALTRAVKLQNKAARVGFDWPSLAPVFDKMREELAELETELNAAPDVSASERIEDEFGDVLFVIANVGRHLKLDPEQALRRANDKFIRRFRRIEEDLAAAGRRPSEASLDEMEALWQAAKKDEKTPV